MTAAQLALKILAPLAVSAARAGRVKASEDCYTQQDDCQNLFQRVSPR